MVQYDTELHSALLGAIFPDYYHKSVFLNAWAICPFFSMALPVVASIYLIALPVYSSSHNSVKKEETSK